MIFGATQLIRSTFAEKKLSALLIITIFFSPFSFAESSQSQLRELNQQLNQANTDLRKSKVRYETLQIEQNASRNKLRTIKVNVDAERKKLKDLRTAEEQFPNIDFTDQLNKQRSIWQKTNREYLTNSAFVDALETKINDSRASYEINLKKHNSIQGSIDHLSDQLASNTLQKQLKSLRKSKRIEIEVRETCSLTVTKDHCRDQARIKAERKASERGAVVVVESITEVKNFNLTKDEVRSQVKARISDIRVTKDSYDLTADKTGWIVDYAISALVTPVVTEQMINDLKSQIVQGLVTGVDSSSTAEPVTNPDSKTTTGAVAEKSLQEKQQRAQRELEEASKKAMQEDQAQAELEAQAIRRQAERIANKEAKKQADDEANLSQKFFPTF